MGPEARIEERLAALRREGLYRDPHRSAAEARGARAGVPLLDARSNDYLGLAMSVEPGSSSVPGIASRNGPPRGDLIGRRPAEVCSVGEAASGALGAAAVRGSDGGRAEAGATSAEEFSVDPAIAGAEGTRDTVSRETGVGTRVGAGAARLISGTTQEHLVLEEQLASWLGMDACLLFSSAYAANLGVVSALAVPGDVIFSDALNHASIIDGCRLSRAQVTVVPHRDLAALASALAAPVGATSAKWVVTESYFGMDGTSPDFRALRALCNVHGAGLIVDEAHSLGVFGPEGRGLTAAHGVHADVLVGGFGKAFGLQGGFAATSLAVHRWLWNRARSFVFSTASSPWLSRRALQHLLRIRSSEPERQRLKHYAQQLERALAAASVPLPPGRHGPVFPVVLGSEQAALDAAEALRPLGVLGHAVRPPTVPPGTSRIRVTLRADMTTQDVERLGAALVRVWNQHGPDQPSAAPSPAPGARPLPSAVAQSGELRPSSRTMETEGRWIVLGTGTGVGKSFVAEALVRAIGARGGAVAGLKPIETGCSTSPSGEPLDGDAVRLEAASFHVKHPRPHPLYGFREALAPSLAAHREGQSIDLAAIAPWVDRARATRAGQPPSLVVETAGGVFSPLAKDLTNFDLALSLGTATWVLVAPDRLGVLHDLGSTLRAMRSLGRTPHWIVLNAPCQPDASTGTNAAELRRLGIPVLLLELPRNQPSTLHALLPPLTR